MKLLKYSGKNTDYGQTRNTWLVGRILIVLEKLVLPPSPYGGRHSFAYTLIF